ncbi:MAG: sn-glycerol-1-phosphate dehydrogenase [Acidimicrobiales bacterium]
MSSERIRTALESATDTRSVSVGGRVLPTVDDLFQRSFGDLPAVVVADENTFAVAGREVEQRLETAGRRLAERYVFPGRPTLYADYRNIEKLVEALRAHDAIPVGVGSGTLNDITKRAAYECERPYMSVATAASMDGYTAFGAAITKEGYKQTMTCPAPRVVLADVDILTGAPPNMTAAGYADLLGKVTAGADWLIADALEIDAIEQSVWSLVQGPLRESTARPAELHAGDRQAMDALIEGLIMSGLAMQAAASSRPASGAEHQFSHLWEMEGLGHEDQGDEPPLSHGFKVGVGTIAIASLYERLLERDLSTVDADAIAASWPRWDDVERRVRAAHPTPGLDEAAVEESRAKYVDADALRPRLALLRERWPEVCKRLHDQLLPAAQLREQLRAAGAPTHPEEIGLSGEAFKDTYRRAQMIRRRYTVLDLTTETGLLGELVDEVFVDGFWARPTVRARR